MDPRRRVPERRVRDVFYTTAVLCGTALLIAVTVKVIIVLFA